VLGLNRVEKLHDPAIERKPATKTKNVNSHEQRIEIKGLSMPEGMQRVGWTSTPFHPNKEQQFVSGICR
jgi:hypothetical protein